MPKNLSKEIKNKEYFLVCVDESNEFQSALEYACINAQKQKINLHTIQGKVQKTGFLPQTLFSLSDHEHDVKVWLE